MSYFMLTCGEAIDMVDFVPVELVQLSSKASNYNYLNPIAQALFDDTQATVFLVDDGETDTSSLFIDEAEELFTQTGDLKNSTLFKIIEKLASNGNAILIWWANNNLLAYQSAHKCTSWEMMFELASKQLRSNQSIQLFLPSNSSLK
jgi:hypothetical protein